VVGKPRLLLAITVYNGRSVVPACLRSAAALRPVNADMDVLVLDDCSPDPGFSEEVRDLCTELGLQYYRSPRNLGIPRNVNLGLMRATDAGYDFVIIANSDVLFAANLPDTLIATAATDPNIGSVTAWSNNVSIFSLPNDDPDLNLRDQERVNWLSETICGHFGTAAVDIPAGISFCILIPVPVIRRVGLMDPVYGRGYCEETDWSLRSKSLGYRITLSPSSFAYHQGGGTNVSEGLLSSGHSSVPAHERIIDHRYPLFRSQVEAFVNSETLDHLRRDARKKIITDAARQWGYSVLAGLNQLGSGNLGPVVILQDLDGTLRAVAHFIGFRQVLPRFEDLPRGLTEYFDSAPARVRVVEPAGRLGDVTAGFSALGTKVQREVCYPSRV
jgi:GT2 family glycosyltransferase